MRHDKQQHLVGRRALQAKEICGKHRKSLFCRRFWRLTFVLVMLHVKRGLKLLLLADKPLNNNVTRLAQRGGGKARRRLQNCNLRVESP
jgi:hypothetical protein